MMFARSALTEHEFHRLADEVLERMHERIDVRLRNDNLFSFFLFRLFAFLPFRLFLLRRYFFSRKNVAKATTPHLKTIVCQDSKCGHLVMIRL